MAPLTPTGLLSGAQQVSSLHVSSLPTIPSPTTPRRSGCLARFCNRTYRRGESQDPSHPLRQGIANVNWASPRTRRLAATTGRIEFVILRTDCSPSDALHLPSQGRSSGRLRDPSQAPTGTSTLLVRYTYDRTSPPAPAGGFYGSDMTKSPGRKSGDNASLGEPVFAWHAERGSRTCRVTCHEIIGWRRSRGTGCGARARVLATRPRSARSRGGRNNGCRCPSHT